METGGSQGITVNPRKRGRGVNIERDVVRMHNENQRCVGSCGLLFCPAVVCVRVVVCLPLAVGLCPPASCISLAVDHLFCGILEAFRACCSSCRCCWWDTCAMFDVFCGCFML
jgi:hypothetical protein